MVDSGTMMYQAGCNSCKAPIAPGGIFCAKSQQVYLHAFRRMDELLSAIKDGMAIVHCHGRMKGDGRGW